MRIAGETRPTVGRTTRGQGERTAMSLDELDVGE